MNFEELYAKYKAGEADDGERATVEAEIEKARKISALLDEGEPTAARLAPADRDTVKKAKRAFTLRSTVRTVIIAVICVVVIAAIGLGGVFGTACISANNAKEIGEEEAVEIAKAMLAQQLGEMPAAVIENVELELDMGSKLIDSVMVYVVWVEIGETHYCVRVSAKTGYAILADKRVDKDKSAPTHSGNENNK